MSIEQINVFPFVPSPAMKKYRIVYRVEGIEKELNFYDTFSDGDGIEKLATITKQENPFLRTFI